jgi:hypothetical protein
MSGNEDSSSGGQGEPVSRRTLLGAIGAGAGLAAAPRAALAGQADGEAAAEGRWTNAELARARIEQFGLGRLAAKPGCFKPNARELYGPTDLNAQSANGRLAVGVNGAGTMTVFRWPRPSFYDQVKYFTEGRDDDADIQVAPNMGAFLGIAADTGDGFRTTWLRDFDEVEQYYANDRDETAGEYSDEIVTRFVDDDLGLDVRVRDLTTNDRDAFVRRVRVHRRGTSPVERARLVAFGNFNLVTEKLPQFPVQDWCLEEDNVSRARYLDRLDAVVYDATGVDVSTGTRRSVAVAMGFGGDTVGHQVGGDAYDPAAEPTGRAGPTVDAYDDAATGSLSGNDEYVGQATSALTTDLSFESGGNVAEETVVVAAAEDETSVATTLGAVREESHETLRERKEAWLADVLAGAPLPDRDAIEAAEGEEVATAVMQAVRRALVVLVTNYDRESGAVVASISTQPPYGEDWPRDGAYFNYVLELIGRHDWVEKRNRWYASIQQQAAESALDGDLLGSLQPSQLTSLTTLPANWNMCYYADGVAGGPIPYQIDTTSYVVWTMYDHYEMTGDEEYLRAVYPAIRRAADFLVQCKDPRNDLQCPAFEDDRFTEPTRQTMNGAAPVWRALRAATDAARVLGREDDAVRYSQRQHELGQAIERELYDESLGGYVSDPGSTYSETVWPLEYTPYVDPETGEIRDRPQVEDPLEHPRVQRHLDADARSVEAIFEEPEGGEVDTGAYEAKVLIPLAKARRETPPGDFEFVSDGVRWLATEHATDDTRVMGEAWKVFPDENGDRDVRSITGQPHVWEQVLLYLATLEAYPPADVAFDDDGIGGVLAALREQKRE